MKQVVQDIRSGKTEVREIPAPIAGPGQVVVATAASLLSAGTERYVVELARKSLVGKARQRPDHVKRVLQKLKNEGLVATAQQVMAKLSEPMPLGYSAAGTVLECGHGVQDFKPGDRVACAGPHAGVVSVGRNLCALVPGGVTFEQAAYTSVAAIGLEGVRLAKVTLGERVLVIGLGLIGQICVALLKAQGCRVIGTDVDPAKLELARSFGADVVALGSPLEAVKAFTGGHGVDAAVITAATESNEPIEFSAAACRTKGRIVLVGVVGLQLPRPPFFAKELEFTVSSSLGPGRGDPSYEEKGIDYPIGHARWTARRNMEAVLDLIEQGKLPVEKLTTHRFPIEQAGAAYDLVTSRASGVLGIVLQHDAEEPPPRRRVDFVASPAAAGKLGVSLIGAGNYARLVLMPVLDRVGGFTWRGLCTAKGMSGEQAARTRGFSFATTEVKEVLGDESTRAVLIATRHDLHADLVIAALEAGKHVFVEKPLCIDEAQLDAIEACVERLGAVCPILTVGFNRRFAPGLVRLKRHMAGATPLSISYRFAPGPIPKEHWTQDEGVGGGRLVGEACHALDACVALTGSLPVRVHAESVALVQGIEAADDRVAISVRHADGSLSMVFYQAGGDKAFPSERLEVFGGGRVAVLDGWDDLELWRDGTRVKESAKRDKGHRSELEAFLAACRAGGAWPIPWAELRTVTRASLLAVRSLREGVPFQVS